MVLMFGIYFSQMYLTIMVALLPTIFRELSLLSESK